MGSKEEALQLVGFPPNVGIQDPEGVRNKLAELFSTYLAEIWEIVQVSSVSWKSQDLGVKPVRWFSPGFLKQKSGLGVLRNYQLLTTVSSLLAHSDVAGSKGRSSGKHEGLRDLFYKPVCTGFLWIFPLAISCFVFFSGWECQCLTFFSGALLNHQSADIRWHPLRLALRHPFLMETAGGCSHTRFSDAVCLCFVLPRFSKSWVSLSAVGAAHGQMLWSRHATHSSCGHHIWQSRRMTLRFLSWLRMKKLRWHQMTYFEMTSMEDAEIQLIWDMLRVLHGFGQLVKRQDFWIPCARSPGLPSTAEWPGHWRGCAGQGCVTSAGGGSPWWTGNIGRSGETQWILAEQLRWENLAEGRSGCFGKGMIQGDDPSWLSMTFGTFDYTRVRWLTWKGPECSNFREGFAGRVLPKIIWLLKNLYHLLYASTPWFIIQHHPCVFFCNLLYASVNSETFSNY